MAPTSDGAHADLHRTVGWFTTTRPVRLDLDGIDCAALDGDATVRDATASAALKAVKEDLADIPGGHGGIGFGVLTAFGGEEADVLRGRGEPQIAFNYLGRVGAGAAPSDVEDTGDFGWQAADDGIALGGAMDPGMVVPAALTINAVTTDSPTGSILSASFAFAGELLDETDVAELADEWVAVAGVLVRHARDGAVGGLTPSDLPLVDVGQADIDAIEAAHDGVDDVWPLAPLQAGLLYHAEVAGADAVDIYTAQVVLELRGPLDIERMRAAANAVVARNPILRSAFHSTVDGRPVAAIVSRSQVGWETVDLTDHDDAAVEADRLLREHRLARFDMTSAPLMRFLVIAAGVDDDGVALTRMSMVNHHILLDGWSGPLLMQQLLALYAMGGEDLLPPPERTYRDFLSWLASRNPAPRSRSGAVPWRASTVRPWWSTPVTSNSPRSTPRRSCRSTASWNSTSSPPQAWPSCPATAGSRSTRCCRRRGASSSRARWGPTDVVFGATVSGRPPEVPEVGSILGLFINTVPARVRLDEREPSSDCSSGSSPSRRVCSTPTTSGCRRSSASSGSARCSTPSWSSSRIRSIGTRSTRARRSTG